jgi:hypothetical protein
MTFAITDFKAKGFRCGRVRGGGRLKAILLMKKKPRHCAGAFSRLSHSSD